MENEQLQIKEFQQAMDLLNEFKARVEAGDIMSLVIIGERTDGALCGGSTAVQNVFTVVGYLTLWAMRRLGFVEFDDVKKLLGGER